MPRRTSATLSLQQATFAARLTEAFEAARKWGIEQKGVAEELGWAETTLSRYKDPEYEKGPPRDRRRRQLEEVIGIPLGYLDRPTGDISLLRKGDVRHSRAGQSAVMLSSENLRSPVAKSTAVWSWKDVAESVARRWHSIIVKRRIPFWDLIELLVKEEEFLIEKGERLRNPALLEAAKDTRALINELTQIQEPR